MAISTMHRHPLRASSSVLNGQSLSLRIACGKLSHFARSASSLSTAYGKAVPATAPTGARRSRAKSIATFFIASPLRATQAIFEHGIRLCAQVSLAPYVYGRDRQLVGLTPTERLNEISALAARRRHGTSAP